MLGRILGAFPVLIILSQSMLAASSYTCRSPKKHDSPVMKFFVTPKHTLSSGPVNISVTCMAEAQNDEGIAYHKIWIARNGTRIAKSLDYCWPDPPSNTGRHEIVCNNTIYLDRDDFGHFNSVMIFCKSQPQTYHCTLISREIILVDQLPTSTRPTSTPTSKPTSNPTSNPTSKDASAKIQSAQKMNEGPFSVIEITGLAVGSLALFICVIFCLVYARRRPSSSRFTVIEDVPISPPVGNTSTFEVDGGRTLELSAPEICLGTGKFGKVVLGNLRTSSEGGEESEGVAVKMLRDFDNPRHRNDFKEEAENLKQLDHPNVLKFIATFVDEERFCIVTEYLRKGDLVSLLRGEMTEYYNQPDASIQRLFGFVLDIANGMEYLTSRNIIHRDLAARNVLVSDDYKCKISDFGLARRIEDLGHYISTQGYVSLKWMALEVFETMAFTVKTDVWSFGIVLWEIFSLGSEPYEPLDQSQSIVLFRSQLSDGYRLAKPALCPDDTFNMMERCWLADPELRPTFNEILQWARPLVDG